MQLILSLVGLLSESLIQNYCYMKNMLKIAGLFLLILSNNLFYSCKKDKESTSVNDIDGNVYKIVTIGTQTWMAENLKTTKLYDGTLIPHKTKPSDWGMLTTFGYCSYSNDSIQNKNIYGALYNWYTVFTSKVCPQGWHVPSDDEWTTLTTFLGGMSDTGGKLKEIGTSHWNSPNVNATNESGFTALPSGCRSNDGTFNSIGNEGVWWSSTEVNNSGSWTWYVYYNLPMVSKSSYPKQGGFSIRCIKN
jgi:uncharacterized protein (TIGR02145 family)